MNPHWLWLIIPLSASIGFLIGGGFAYKKIAALRRENAELQEGKQP